MSSWGFIQRSVVFGIAFILSSLVHVTAYADEVSCPSIFDDWYPRSMSSLVDADLLQLQVTETFGRTRDEIARMNEITLDTFYQIAPNNTANGRIKRLPRVVMQKMIKSIARHPVVSDAAVNRKYENQKDKISYCFGRAMYHHLTLLAMGVDKSSIAKVWAVGPMDDEAGSWQFHVATIVRGWNNRWYVIDHMLYSYPIELRKWSHDVTSFDQGGRVRIYITEPEKWSAANAYVGYGHYNPVDLGFGMTRQTDFFTGFFTDLMQWFRESDLESVGLRRLIP